MSHISAFVQVSGVYEGIYELRADPQERQKALAEATETAKQRAVEAGASAESCQVEVPPAESTC